MPAHPSGRWAWLIVCSLSLFCGSLAVSRAQDELPPEIDSDGVETLTRGPVHEAFASPTVADPAPGMVVPKPPPADIKEQPPEYQPDGQNVQWFPGYWAWDEDRDDYIWISGAWRDPPPGKRWVPGYWAEVPGGFQWVAGFWINDQVEEMEYQKPPPQSLEQGPSIASPGDDYFYIPGNWTYVNNDYVWSAGYWAPYREDWVYVPAHWVWTPRGCVFVAGYWDWRLPRRGQIFAPIYAAPVVYQRPTYFYQPRCVINTSNLFVHLWVRPTYSHYYFGNYYGPSYVNRNFTPWCNYTARPRCYDPLFTYCNVHYHRQGINYADRMQGWHNHYVNQVNDRPPMTWRDQTIMHQNKGPDRFERNSLLGQDLKDVIHTPNQHQPWKKLDLAAKDHNKASIDQVKQLHQMRFDQEKFNIVHRDPKNDLPGRDVPGRDGPGRDGPGRDGPDRDGRPNRGPDLALPGVNPGVKDLIDKPGVPGKELGTSKTPADQLANLQQNLPGKFKLPKPAVTTTSLSPNKPKIEVPAAPEKTVVSRPTGRPDILNKQLDKPLDLGKSNPLGNPLSDLNKPNLDKSNRVPGQRNPAANLGPKLDLPGSPTATKLPDVKTNQPKNPLPGLDLGNAKKPDLGGKPKLGGTSNEAVNSATNAAQQRLDAIRKQQQDAINNLRNPKVEPSTPKAPLNLGGNSSQTKIETPRVDKTPKVELPKREVVRPPLSSGSSNQPRNLGGGNAGGINLGGGIGGNSVSKPNITPRITTPNVEPRGSRPSNPVGPTPSNNLHQLQPRHSASPRPQPGTVGGGSAQSHGKHGR